MKWVTVYKRWRAKDEVVGWSRSFGGNRWTDVCEFYFMFATVLCSQDTINIPCLQNLQGEVILLFEKIYIFHNSLL